MHFTVSFKNRQSENINLMSAGVHTVSIGLLIVAESLGSNKFCVLLSPDMLCTAVIINDVMRKESLTKQYYNNRLATRCH